MIYKISLMLGAAAVAMLAVPAIAQDSAPDSAPDLTGQLRSPTFQANIAEKSRDAATAPNDPYPIEADGWGTSSGNLFSSRWVEDWTKLKAEGKAPPLKAMPIIGDEVYLTLNGELRIRSHHYDNGLANKGDDYHEVTDRVELGADLHIGDHFRIYGELDHGDTRGEGTPSVNALTPAYQNKLAAQQIFGEARDRIGDVLFGVIGGRFEYNDGPRQLLSINNGPDERVTWNGAQFYLHTDRFRFGAFTGRPTLEEFGFLNGIVNPAVKLQTITASIAVEKPDKDHNLYLDPLYYHFYNAAGLAGATTGNDRRETYGARIWGKQGPFVFDWMAFRQTGDHIGRPISAWMASLDQNVQIGDSAFKPHFGVRIDLASGGDGFKKNGAIHDFNPIYQGTSYLGEGHLIGYSNLFMVSPTVGISPLKNLRINAEYDMVRRLAQNDAVYFFGQPPHPYARTQTVSGYDVGGYGRLIIDWNVTQNIDFTIEGDHLTAGEVLERAGFHHANYAMLSLDFRY